MYGAFTRMLRKYVQDEHLMSIEEAVRKMTTLPAKVYQLDKGFLAEGKDADLNIFRLENIADHNLRKSKAIFTGIRLCFCWR